ncbi:hypothetical protein ACFL2V_13460 [Pseudomonadota bacterium]
MKDRICTSCYYIGQPTTQGIGSFAVDAMMWMIFFSMSMFSSIFPLMIIPVAWTAYHIAIYRKSTCPKCSRINMVSMTSSKGRRALAGPSAVVTYRASEDPERIAEEEAKNQEQGSSDDEKPERRNSADVT